LNEALWVSFWGSLLCYLGCAVFTGVQLGKDKGAATLPLAFLVLGGVLHTVHFACRWIQQGQPPMVRQADLFVLLSLSAVATYLLAGRRLLQHTAMGWVSLFALLLMAWQAKEGHSVRPLIPALRSPWLTIHVFFCMVAYGALTLGSFTCVWILFRPPAGNSGEGKGPVPFAERMIQIGYAFLTLGIVTGSIWAQRAWGRYWGWDPKETASLVTWFVYLAYLHYPKGTRFARKAALLGVAGILCVAFTWFGVALLPGLHSYQ